MPLQGLLGTGLDFLGAKQQQRWSKQAAGRQMDFQERMSNTAYQRAMADMSKAGINPIMVAKLGGASTPTGAMAATPKLENIGSNAVKNIATAQQIKYVGSQTSNMQAQTAKLKAETKHINDRNKYEFGTYEGLIKQKELKNIELQGDLIREKISATRLSNEMSTFNNRWFINDYGAPAATLTAKVQNYIASKAFTKMPKKQEDHLIKQIHRAVQFVQNNAEKVLNNPEILYSMFGAYAAGFVTDAVFNKIKGFTQLPKRNRQLGKGKSNAKK